MSPIIKSETPGLLENDKETRHMCTHVHPPTNMMARHNHHNPNKTAKDFRSQNTHTLLPALYEYVSTCSTSLYYTSMYQHVILLVLYKYASTGYTTCIIQVCINMLYCLHYTSMYQHVLPLCTIQVRIDMLYYLHYTSMHQHVILPALYKYVSTCYTTCTIQVCINMFYCLHQYVSTCATAYTSMYQYVLLPTQVRINMFYCLQCVVHRYVIQLALYKSVSTCFHHHTQTTHTVYFLRRDLSLPTWSSTATRTLQTRCGSFPACLIIMATLSVFMATWAATLGLKSVKKWSPSVWRVPSARPCTGVESSRPSTSIVHWKVTTARLTKEALRWVSNVWRDRSTMFGHALYTVRLPP